MGGLEQLLMMLLQKNKQQAQPWNGAINGQMPQRQQLQMPAYTGMNSGQLNRQPQTPQMLNGTMGRYNGGGVRG